MADLTVNDINAALAPTPQDKPPLRQHIEQFQQNLATGEGILPKVIAGAAMLPAAVSSLKMREMPTIKVNQ